MTKPIPTADLCDVFMRRVHTDFAVLPPVLTHFGGRKAFSGPVRTMKCFEDNSMVKEALEEPGWVDTALGRLMLRCRCKACASHRGNGCMPMKTVSWSAIRPGPINAPCARAGWPKVG